MRRQNVVVIDAEGRDKGKRYIVREQSALAAERWAIRAFLALARSGVDIPDNIEAMGLAGLATVSLQALSGIDTDTCLQLLDEMLGCIAYCPDRSNPSIERQLLTGDDGDIEEVLTLYRLRQEVLSVHLGFSLADAIAKQKTESKTKSAPAS